MNYVIVATLSALLACAAWAYWPAPTLAPGVVVDRIVVYKADRRLELIHGDEVVAAYRVALGPQPVGPKREVGDGKTPEGKYTIDYHNPESRFHLALHISYPSSREAEAARADGSEPGGMIMIHGLKNGLGKVGRIHTFLDWTDGCIAVMNSEIEQIYNVVKDGTPIRIEP